MFYMGMFDNVSRDEFNAATFTQQAKAFASMDLNYIIMEGVKGLVNWVANVIAYYNQYIGNNNCNTQDRQLVERFIEQIPGMALALAKSGILDSSLVEPLSRSDPNEIIKFMNAMGMPKGAEPCNSLLGPARTLFTILFGVRIRNQHTLDALQNGIDAYYAHDDGVYQYDIPRSAVERAVMLKQNFFPDTMYNTQQWDLNYFQAYPLLAPVPDPFQPGSLYTGDFMGMKIVNGYAIGDAIPHLPDPMNPVADPVVLPPLPPVDDDSFMGKIVSFIRAHPIESVLMGVGGGWLLLSITDEK